jgi:diaminopimelate decarboxylase
MKPSRASNSPKQHDPRPPGLVYKASSKKKSAEVLYCEGKDLRDLAKTYGTPLYLYSAQTLRERTRALDAAFKGFPHTLCYAVKANSNLTLLAYLAKLGCGFDVVSGGELERVLRAAPRTASTIVFSGVGKTRQEIELALRADILLFNVESEAELGVLLECATRLRKKTRMAVRVNPNVAAKTHPYITTGLRQHKFGIPIEEARRLYAQVARHKYVVAAGISVHIGSQITSVAPFGEAMERVAALTAQLKSEGHAIRYVDAGGGLGIPYRTPHRMSPQGAAPDFAKYVRRYAQAVMKPLRKLDVHLLLEPGRILVGPAGVLLTSVLYTKSNRGKGFVIVDAAMNDLLRPVLYAAHHEIVPVVRQDSPKQRKVDIVGPICESGDFLARDRMLAEVQSGELLAVLDAGAYGTVLSSNYNTRPRPAEVLVEGRRVRVIRRRETFDDLIRSEKTNT